MLEREIKFRIWCKELGKMIYSCKSDEQGKREYIPFCFPIGFSGWENYELSPLMQFTGLKDRNGVEIYEGDIIKWGHIEGSIENPIRVAIVEYNPDLQFVTQAYTFRFGCFGYQDTDKYIEVIAHIYEFDKTIT